MNTQHPSPEPATSRRFGATTLSAVAAAVAVGGLAVGGTILGSHMASAAADEPAPEPASDAESDDIVVNAEVSEEELDELFGPYDDCLAEQLPDVFGDEFIDVAEPVEIDELEAQSMDLPDSVTLYSADDDSVSFFDFGDGDGEITITKVGDDISVSVDGDVERFDEDVFLEMPELDEEWAAWEAEFDAAHEACADLLPDDVLVDDAVIATEPIVVESAPAES